jgi:hypothetical protein
MRLLAVIGSELMGADERSDWGLPDALVAANGVARGGHAQVLFLVYDRPSWRSRLAGRNVVTRLRQALDIPVDVPGRPELDAPRPDGS